MKLQVGVAPFATPATPSNPASGLAAPARQPKDADRVKKSRRTGRLHATLATVLALAAPLACQADTGPCATVTGGSLPDLIVNATKLAQYLSVGEEKYAPSSCAVQEKFVSSPGWHTLLRFTSSTPNIGAGALVIGAPQNCPALFVQSACHGHLHFKQYADYRLWTPSGYQTWLAMRDLSLPSTAGVNAATLLQASKSKSLLMGRKMGFCMIDSEIYSAGVNTSPTFVSCLSNQGVSVGWADSYGANLEGQYLEIDSLKSGDYVLEVHVNAEQLLPEANFQNNSSAITVRYTARQGSAPASIQVLP